MTALLLKLFVKNYQRTDSAVVRAAIGRLAGLTGIVCNLLLFVTKLTVGLLSGAVSIVADAANNLSDASSSAITLLAFYLSQKPADKDHPFGHARYEYLAGLGVAVLILMIGLQLALTSIDKIWHPSPIDINILSIGILLASIVCKLWMSLFFNNLGKRISSVALCATASDSRNDVIATAAVLLACVIQAIFHVNIDGIAGLAVAAFILYSGFKVAKDTISPLLGAQADEDLVRRLHTLLLSHDKVLGAHDLLIHDYGPGRCFASVHVELSADESALVCHDIIDGLERRALEQYGVQLVIHFDPVDTHNTEQEALQQLTTKLLCERFSDVSLHDFRLLLHDGAPTLMFDIALPYAYHGRHDELKAYIDGALSRAGHHYTTVVHFDEI